MIFGIDKLAPESPHRVRIAIMPASIATVRVIALAEIDGRFCRAKVRWGCIFLFHFLFFNTNTPPAQGKFFAAARAHSPDSIYV